MNIIIPTERLGMRDGLNPNTRTVVATATVNARVTALKAVVDSAISTKTTQLQQACAALETLAQEQPGNTDGHMGTIKRLVAEITALEGQSAYYAAALTQL